MISLYSHSEFNFKINMMGLCCGFISYVFYCATPISYAEIVVDKSAPLHQQPGVTSINLKESSNTYCKALNAYCRGANYTAINIQTPNVQGVSYNKYIKFDVTKGAGYDKVSLNNFLASSEIGNPNLPTVSAKVILNEVTSGQQTLLNGSLIVAGDKAHIIIANPAGVYCDGCSFSNTAHVTLTTGIPIFSTGYFRGYNVIAGGIDIGSNGLTFNDNAETYLDIFSRSLIVGGEIKANDILSIVGKQAVSYAGIGGRVNVKSLAGFTFRDKNNIGIDVNHLGGMYANKIFILSRDGGIKNSGVIHADNTVRITSDEFIVNKGRISGENIIINSLALVDNQSGSIKNIKHISNVNVNEMLGIKINGKIIDNKKGYIYSNVGSVIIDADDKFYNAYGLVKTIGSYGRADIEIKAETVNNFNGIITTSNNISINTDHFKNNQGRVVSAFGAVNLRYKTLEDTTGVIHGGIGVKRTIK